MTVLPLLTAAALAASTAPAPTDSTPRDASPIARPVGAQGVASAEDTVPRRRRAVEVSDGYATRLKIHRIGSYTMLPLFAAQFVLGQKMLNEKTDAYAGTGGPVSDGTRTAHQFVAGGIGTLFVVNTVTGVWNLVESRRQAEGRGLRTTHALLMLASEAGFVATAVLGARASDHGPGEARTHRNVALASMAPATIGAALMWFRRD